MLFRLAELRYQQSIQLRNCGSNCGNRFSKKSFTFSSTNTTTTGDGDDDDDGDDKRNERMRTSASTTTTTTTVDGLTAFQSNPFALLRDGVATFSVTDQTSNHEGNEEIGEETEWESFQYLRYLK